MDRATYWDEIYSTRGEQGVSWFEADPATSMGFIRRAIAGGARSAVDVGGGASRLVDLLLDEQLDDVAVLDVSERGEQIARERLGDRADRVRWILGDVTRLEDVGAFDLWHDRAVFHFLVDGEDRHRYLALMARAVPIGGFVVLAAFAPDGPERCSGLDVCRYDSTLLGEQLGQDYELVDELSRTHVTPRGVEQRFTHTLFRRTAD
jgi:SAM-dependent methyltransferase